MPQRNHDAQTSESGFTLVELLIYMVFAVIVLTLVGGMLINTLNAEKSIVSRSEATTSGQAVAQSVHNGVRNAVAHRLTPDDAETDTDQLLIVQQLALGTEPATCLAWYYDAVDSAIYYQRTDATPISAPDNDYGGWLLLATGVQSESRVFDHAESDDGTRIALSFSVAVNEDSAPVPIESTTISRKNPAEAPVCFGD